MVDRRGDLRREAARCLEAAKQSNDPNSRADLTRLAAKFLELADQPPIDIRRMLDEYNIQQMMPTARSEPVVQQQQQVQPDNDKKR
jgi:hypothetical protein